MCLSFVFSCCIVCIEYRFQVIRPRSLWTLCFTKWGFTNHEHNMCRVIFEHVSFKCRKNNSLSNNVLHTRINHFCAFIIRTSFNNNKMFQDSINIYWIPRGIHGHPSASHINFLDSEGLNPRLHVLLGCKETKCVFYNI